MVERGGNATARLLVYMAGIVTELGPKSNEKVEPKLEFGRLARLAADNAEDARTFRLIGRLDLH